MEFDRFDREKYLPWERVPVKWRGVGGRPSLEFVNTRWRRGTAEAETLRAPDELGAWLVHAGVVEEPPSVSRAVLDEALALRTAIEALVDACLQGRAAPVAAVAHVDRWIARAGVRPALLRGADGFPLLGERGPADSPRRALGDLALDAARVLGTPESRARVRVCEAEHCHARFYDRSPSGLRTWCSMDTCGNAAKARRHRARRRGEPVA